MTHETTAPVAALSAEISRDLLSRIVDEVFDGAIEDATVIEDIYRVIASAQHTAPVAVPAAWSEAQVRDFLSVALRHVEIVGSHLLYSDINDGLRYMAEKGQPAFVHAAPTPPAGQREIPVAVPEGWKPVPERPTIEMVEAGYEASLGEPDRSGRARVFDQYKAMLATAPTLPAGQRESPCTPPAQQPVTGPILPEDARELLEELQWQHHDYDDYYHKAAGYYCPDCGAPKEEGHRPTCAFPKVLAYPVSAPPAQQSQQSQLVPVSKRLPDPDEHSRVLIYTDGVDFQGEQFFDVKAEQLNENSYEYPEDMPEVCRHATHWMPLPAAPGDTATPTQQRLSAIDVLTDACEEALAWFESRTKGLAIDAKDSLRMALAAAQQSQWAPMSERLYKDSARLDKLQRMVLYSEGLEADASVEGFDILLIEAKGDVRAAIDAALEASR